MNLTRQFRFTFKDGFIPVCKHGAYNPFRITRELSNACTKVQHHRGERTVLPTTICKRSMSTMNKKRVVDKSRRQEAGTNLSGLTPVLDVGLSHEDELPQLRFAVKDRVENAIRHRFGSSFHVEFFGSIHYGVSHPKSDLDLVVIDPRLPQGFKRLHKLGAIYNIRGVANALSRAGFTKITHRASAAVPIVKFRDPVSGLDCDLNVNDRLGILNSSMIKQYCDAHPFLRPLLHRIKGWAKPLGLNSPSPPRGSISFSSYALVLMTIGFLQREGHLPNLQENLPPLSKSESKTLIWTRKPHQAWDVRFQSAKDWVPPPLPDFDTLLCSWFSFWINFPYETESISIRDGGAVPRVISTSKTAIPPISVTDPFILTKNVTISISKRTLVRFKTECQNMITRSSLIP